MCLSFGRPNSCQCFIEKAIDKTSSKIRIEPTGIGYVSSWQFLVVLLHIRPEGTKMEKKTMSDIS